MDHSCCGHFIRAIAGEIIEPVDDLAVTTPGLDEPRQRVMTGTPTLVAAHAQHVVSLPGLPDKGDVSDWLDADTSNAEKQGRRLVHWYRCSIQK